MSGRVGYRYMGPEFMDAGYRVVASCDQIYCDNCGKDLRRTENRGGRLIISETAWWYDELPFPVDSANEGESAVLCTQCQMKLEKEYTNGD